MQTIKALLISRLEKCDRFSQEQTTAQKITYDSTPRQANNIRPIPTQIYEADHNAPPFLAKKKIIPNDATRNNISTRNRGSRDPTANGLNR